MSSAPSTNQSFGSPGVWRPDHYREVDHPPADAMPNGHQLGPGEVLVGHQACLGHGGGHTTWTCRTCDQTVYGPPMNTHCSALEGLRRYGSRLAELGNRFYFSSKTRSSMGLVICTLLPVTSTMASSPVVECPVDKMKNLSAA